MITNTPLEKKAKAELAKPGYIQITADVAITQIGKVLTSSIGYWLLQNVFTKQRDLFETAHKPATTHKLKDNIKYLHKLLPITHTPKGKVYMLMREPVARFVSACGQEGLTVDEAIAKLTDPEKPNAINGFHWRPQTCWIQSGMDITVFPLETKLAAYCDVTGIQLGDIHINKRAEPRQPTKSQLKKIKEIYAEDVVYYDTLRS